MSQTAKKDKSFFHDLSWYMLGAMIPMLLNLFKTPIFTRHYSTEDFGYLGLIMTTFGYLSTISFSWLASCIWRYYNEFKKRIGLHVLYSNILFLFILSSFLILILTLIMLTIFHYKEMDFIVLKLTFLAFLHFCTKELLALYMVIVRIKGFARTYNYLLILQVFLAFALLLLFAFVLKMDISAMILSSLLIDCCIILVLIIRLIKHRQLKSISLKLVSRRITKIMFSYGSVTLVAALFLMLIVSSDRYIIAMYDTISNVGIYTKVYDISQLSIMAFAFVYFNTINPRMIKELTYNFKNADQLLVKYLYAFLFFGIPVTTLSSIYSKEIVQILLGEDFRSGYIIMPSVFFSALISGLVKFYENKLKFANKTLFIARVFGISLMMNLLMNFLFVPKFGYIAAAYSTLVTYIFILVCFLRNDSMSFFKRKDYLKDILIVVILMALFWLADAELRKLFEFDLKYAILEGILFLGIFVLIFYKKIKKLDLPID